MVFNSGFSQESLLNLMLVIDKQLLMIGTQRKRFFHIMIEMVQNIINHASINEVEGNTKSGIFFIRENINSFSLYTGNYIKNIELEVIKNKIDLTHESEIMLLVFKLDNISSESIKNLELKYGLWEKRNQNIRLEKSFNFKIGE